MLVSANNQIGYPRPTHARAYGARARTGHQPTKIPFNVHEGSGNMGKIDRQNLQSQVNKVDGERQGRPLYGDGNTMVLGLEYRNTWPSGGDENAIPTPGNWEAAQADFTAYFSNTAPGTVTSFAGGTLTMGMDGYATYMSPTGQMSKFDATTPLRDIAIGSQDIRNAWGQKYGLGIVGPSGAYYMPFGETVPTNSTAEITVPASTDGDENAIPTPGNWEAAQADFTAYFNNTAPGTVTSFAGGTLTMGMDGYATYMSPTGQMSKFDATTPLRDIAIGSQDIRNAWGQKYGLGIMGPAGAYFMPFGKTVPANSIAAITVPGDSVG